jgi:hypothetical protein
MSRSTIDASPKAETSNDNAEAFAARKVNELDEYDEALEKREEDKALVDGGKMTKEEFIANNSSAAAGAPRALTNPREVRRGRRVQALCLRWRTELNVSHLGVWLEG